MVRDEHRPGCKGLTATLRCLDLVLREGNCFSDCAGRIEAGGVSTGLHEWPVEEVVKLEGRLNYLKSWSPLLLPYWLMRDRNFRPKRNRSIAHRVFRLLALFSHFILIAGGRRKGFMLEEKNGSLGIPSERHPI